jgi:opacity protein-like surface antigen
VKRSILLLAAGLLAAVACGGFPAPARAQVHGALSNARVVPVNSRLGGGYLQFDKSSATLMGQLRLSFYPNLDFGFLGGLSRIDVNDNTRTSVRLGGDFRGQLATQNASFPVDVLLGGALGVETADELTILSVGPQLTVSRALDLSGRWIGYGGAALLLSRIELSSQSDNDISFPVRFGIEYDPNPYLRMLAEVQLAVSDEVKDDFAATLGVLFPF